MKRLGLLLLLFVALAGVAYGQKTTPLRVRTVDSTTNVSNARVLVFPNGSLSNASGVVTVTTSSTTGTTLALAGPSGSLPSTVTGLDLDGWTGSGPTTSIGIHIGSSVDIGTTKYAVKSDSVGLSRFAGAMQVKSAFSSTSGAMPVEFGSSGSGFANSGNSIYLILGSSSLNAAFLPTPKMFSVPSDWSIGFSSTNPANTNSDTGVGRDSPGVTEFNNGTAVTNGGTLNDAKGRNFFIVQSIQGAKTKALTESSATGFVDISVASGSFVGGVIDYTVNADDGTNFQVDAGQVAFTAVNKAGTVTTNVQVVGTDAQTLSSGTLTVSFTATAGTNKTTINCNAVSSLTQTTLNINYRIRVNTGVATTVTPL
jgi:hypothetical protein